MPADVVREATPQEVTPQAGKGALGTWRALAGPGLCAGITVTRKDGPSPACKPPLGGAYMSQHVSFPILNNMSRLCKAVPRLATIRSGVLPLPASDAGMRKGRFQG